MTTCANACMNNYACKSFGWSSTTSTCQLYPRSLQHMNFAKASSGDVMYYHRQCFKKTCSRVKSTSTPAACVCTQISTCEYLCRNHKSNNADTIIATMTLFTDTTTLTFMSSAPTVTLAPVWSNVTSTSVDLRGVSAEMDKTSWSS